MNPEIKSCERNIHAISMSKEFLDIYSSNLLHMRALLKLIKYTSQIELYPESQKIIEETLKKLKIEYIQKVLFIYSLKFQMELMKWYFV